MTSLESHVKAIIAQQLEVPVDEGEIDAAVKSASAAGSTGRTNMLIALQENFDIYIAEDDVNEFTKTRDVIDYVSTKLWWYAI